MQKKLLSLLVVIAVLAGVFVYAGQNEFYTSMVNEEQDTSVTTLHMWYTDGNMTDYLNSAALAFYENTGVKVNLELKSGLEYLEEINDATLHSQEIPDLYIVSDDSLEKAYLSGLASKIQDESGVMNQTNFPQTALNAVTYRNMMVAYPFYYETSALIYNKTYLKQIAQNAIASEQETETVSGEMQSDDLENATSGEVFTDKQQEIETTDSEALNSNTEEAIEEKMLSMIPTSFDAILELADEYDPPEGMEGYLEWDVSDIFYNYFFVGNYISVGGENGDDLENITIYNEQAKGCLDAYQRLNQFFSIDAEVTDYESVIEDFIEGKYLFTIATTDVIARLENAKQDGSFQYDYGVAMIPMVSDGTYFVDEYIEDENGQSISEEDMDNATIMDIDVLQSRGLSVTNTIAVNGFSEHSKEANEFATFITTQYLDTLYDRTGKVACSYIVKHDNPAFDGFMSEYEKSISMPKITEISNFWIQLEVCFTKVWKGEDSDVQLKQVADQISMQMGN